jgi:fructosamine-3-kinase
VRIPDGVRRSVEAALEDRTGSAAEVVGTREVGGGCISPTARIETGGGGVYFLKWSTDTLPDGLLSAEADGLARLAAAGAIRVPEVVARDDGASAWLLLEWLPPGSAGPGSWSRLGRSLAALHHERADRFGAPADNFIGSLPQANDPGDSWARFWEDRRLAPQLRSAVESGLLDRGDEDRFQALFRRLPDLLGPGQEDGPSLLHGDLWNGNVHMMEGGEAAVVDPSVYSGHREVDLAMADLFGGFPAAFREAYEAEWPLAPGYVPVRRAVYQLYYLLVHVNLFGAGYVGRTRGALDAAGV